MQLMKIDGIDRLGFLVHDAARLMRRRFEEEGSHYGLSSAQWRALVRVVREEGITQARLADLMEIEPISVSRLMDRMEDGGWVERRPDPADRRVRLIFATQKSRETFAAIKSVAADVYEKALAGLSDDDRRALVRGLAAMVDNLADGDAGPETNLKGAAA